MFKKARKYISDIFLRERFIQKHTEALILKSKLLIQGIVSLSFLILSIANIFSQSYFMLVLTSAGCIVNAISLLIARKYRNSRLCTLSSIMTCSLLFIFFVIYGGNDGFACLWVTLVPFMSMIVMDFTIGLMASIFFQVFIIVVFWTPVRYMLFYSYGDQFCLRFPLFFFVTFMFGLFLTISLRKSQYNEYKHQLELEKMTAAAHNQARTDSLTGLSNRRGAYEQFDASYSDMNMPHCVIMGDIDFFKNVNDTYGHEFGDEVLTVISEYIKTLLPDNYLKSRWGGEEFLFAANETKDSVFTKIEGLRKAIAKHEFLYDGKTISVTITFGIAEYSSPDKLADAINTADNRLYKGKKASRNCTVTED